MLSDFHIHSHFSADSDANPEDIIKKAISLGMTDICFTDHNDFDFPGDLDFTLDTNNYFNAISSLKKQYSRIINVGIGIEVGLEPYLSGKIHSLITENDFDFVIGSSHLINKKDPYYPEYFEGRKESECFEEYFFSILDNINTIDDFDVYGHIDYIVRYPKSKDTYYSYSLYHDILDEILKKLIYDGKGIEINSGGYRSGLSFPNPHPDVIKRYRELGGEIITLGSDAHLPKYIGSNFEDIQNILKTCNFKYYTIFKNRRPSFIRL